MRRGLALFLAHWSFFSMGLGDASVAPSLPTFAQNLDVPLVGMGILFTARAVGFLAVYLAAGWLTARLGRARLMVIALGLTALAMAALPVNRFLPLELLAIGLYGFGAGALGVSVNALVGDLSPRERSVAMNRLYLFVSLGAFTGPLIVGASLSALGVVAPPFWISALMMAVAMALLWRVPLPKLPPAIRRIGSQAVHRDRRVWLLIGLLFVFVGIDSGFNAWVFSYVHLSLGSQVAVASAASSAFWIAAMTGRLARLGPLRRAPDGPLMVASCASGLLAIGVLVAFRTPVIAVLASVWLGASLSTLYPTIMGLGSQLRPEESVAVISLLGISSAAGALTLPLLYGRFLGGTGDAWPVALLVNMALLFALALVVSRAVASKAKAAPS